MSSSRPSSRRKNFDSRGGRPGWRKRHKVFLTFQNLEQRRLMATFSVINTNDSGAGSLRQAIIGSNGMPGANTIDFNVPGTGVQTISLLSALPSVTVPVLIDGTTQTGYTTAPLIDLDGTSAGSSANGLDLAAGSGGSTIRALVITNFTADGILITTTDNTVQSSYIGTNAAGTAAGSQPMAYGVFVTAGSNNTIGGTALDDGNVISGNSVVGVAIENSGTTGNVVEGNLIGTNAAGTVAVPNTTGVDIIAASNTIGGTVPGAGNLISGNTDYGIFFANQSDNLLAGNKIGTDITGEVALPNEGGVGIDNSTGDTIGGTTSGAGNLISGNSSQGINIGSASPSVTSSQVTRSAPTPRVRTRYPIPSVS